MRVQLTLFAILTAGIAAAQEIPVLNPIVKVRTNEVVIVKQVQTNVTASAWITRVLIDMTPRAAGTSEVSRIRVWAEDVPGFWEMPADVMNANLGTNDQHKALELITGTATLATGVGRYVQPRQVR